MFGTATITNSTIANNTASGGSGANNGQGLGGGLFNVDGSVTLLQDTIAFNTVSTDGGSVYNLAFGNFVSGVPGGPQSTASLTIYNSILAGSTGGTSELVNNTDSGSITAQTNVGVIATTKDLVASNTNDGTGTLNPTGFITGNPNFLSTMPVNNGGRRPTIAINNTSAAFNAGDNSAPGLSALPFDERGPGFTRIVFTAVDLGAFEVQQPPQPPSPPPPSPPAAAPSSSPPAPGPARRRGQGLRRRHGGRCCSTSSLTTRPSPAACAWPSPTSTATASRTSSPAPGQAAPGGQGLRRPYRPAAPRLLRRFHSTRSSPAASSWPAAT